MDGVLKRSVPVHNRDKNLIESANAKVRANVSNSGSLISTANLRGLSFYERDNNKQGK
jgi:hypothetical protein